MPNFFARLKLINTNQSTASRIVEAFTKKLHAENNVKVGGGRALFTTAGGNLAFASAVLAITDPGDEVIIQSPYYFNHEMAITMANVRPVDCAHAR